MKLRIIIFSLLACILTACSSDPVSTTGSIEGTVYDANQVGVRLQGASVTITKLNRTVTTGADGHYAFSDVPQGDYEVQVSKTDYVTDSKQVTVSVEQTAKLDFSLRSAGSSLIVTPLTLDYGTTDTNLSIDIKNNGQAQLNWQIIENVDWISCAQTSGIVLAGKQTSVVLTADRSGLKAGTYTNTIVITSDDGGSQAVRLSLSVTDDAVVLTTGEVTVLTQSSALVQGMIVSTGRSSIFERGVCYVQASAGTPTVMNTTVASTDQTANFVTRLTNLQGNTEYNARAYVRTNDGNSYYGNTVSFTTFADVKMPQLSTVTVTEIGRDYITLSASVTDTGQGELKEVGFCWTNWTRYYYGDDNGYYHPSIADNHITLGHETSFTGSVTGLKENTTYYVRAYARNDAGVAYGPIVECTTDVSPNYFERYLFPEDEDWD